MRLQLSRLLLERLDDLGDDAAGRLEEGRAVLAVNPALRRGDDYRPAKPSASSGPVSSAARSMPTSLDVEWG